MKIGIITDSLDDSIAGIAGYTRALVTQLLRIDKKNEYVLIHHTLRKDPLYDQASELIVPLRNIPFAREYRKIFELPRILEKTGFDLVHETTQIGPFFRKRTFRQVVTIHDLCPLVRPEFVASKKVSLHHRIGLKIVLKNIDRVIAVSKQTRDDIKKFFPKTAKKITTIYEAGIPRTSTKKSTKKVLKKYGITKPYFFFMSTIEPRKNLENMIRAFHLLDFKGQFVIGGKRGWKSKSLFSLIEKLGSKKKIIFTGFIADEDVNTLYKEAQAFLFPSWHEGFGLPVLEAMSAGCPVITSNCSSLLEAAGKAALLVNPAKPKEIAKAMLQTFDKKTRARLIKQGRLQAKRFSWKTAAQKTLAVYEEVVR